MSENQPKKLTLYYGNSGDLYEIIIGGETVMIVIKYRRGVDGLGEEVDFDELSYHIQQGICQVIQHALNNLKE